MQAIEDFDRKIVGPLLRGLEAYEDFRIMALPDHPTPISLKTHAADPVPFVLFSSGDRSQAAKEERSFDENSARKTGLFIEQGHELMEKFINGS
jgi:2,3-bisphosphoglycerate-independent phosphoglycerate mutase